ncbi:MAG: ribulose-phosphate 3-epimerase, partial [Planctomycetota bacterium]
GGQRFMEHVLDKTRWLRAQGFQGHIEMDGGLNAETIPLCAGAGADVFVAGSAIFGAPDRKAAIEGFRASALAASSFEAKAG